MRVITRLHSITSTILSANNLRIQSYAFPTTLSFASFSFSSTSVADSCQLAQAARSEVDLLLKGINDRTLAEEIKHIVEMANRASLRREVLHTDFLTPPIWNEAMVALKKLADVNTFPNGGYPEAERCRLTVGHPEVLTTVPETVAALSVTGNFRYQPPSHGDFLGSILGTGIVREKVGDIILQGERGAQVLVVPDLVDYIISSLDKIGRVPVTCTLIPLESLEYEPPRTHAFKTVESSLRVDALASAGFKISRSKFADLISKGDVRINWSTVTKNGAPLKNGDIVSVSGKGRLKIGEIQTTKKGKYSVELIRQETKVPEVRSATQTSWSMSGSLAKTPIAMAATAATTTAAFIIATIRTGTRNYTNTT